MNKIIILSFVLSLGSACSIDITKQSEAAAGSYSSGAGRPSHNPAGGEASGGGGSGGLGGGSNAVGGSAGSNGDLGGSAGSNGNLGGSAGSSVIAGGGSAGLGALGGAPGTGGAPSAPPATQVCKSTTMITCGKLYMDGCIPVDDLASLKGIYGPTLNDCIKYLGDQCSGPWDCSLSDNYSPANNQKCADETNALTCEQLTNGATAESCSLMCDAG